LPACSSKRASAQSNSSTHCDDAFRLTVYRGAISLTPAYDLAGHRQAVANAARKIEPLRAISMITFMIYLQFSTSRRKSSSNCSSVPKKSSRYILHTRGLSIGPERAGQPVGRHNCFWRPP
jgi:hypothetical protein